MIISLITFIIYINDFDWCLFVYSALNCPTMYLYKYIKCPPLCVELVRLGYFRKKNNLCNIRKYILVVFFYVHYR